MGKKSFNKRRGGGKRGGGGADSGAGDPGLELMEVDPAPLTAKVESTILAKQSAVLPTSVQKVHVPSLESSSQPRRPMTPKKLSEP